MGFFLNLLTLPVLGAPRMVHWLAQTMVEEGEREALDEGRIRAALMELQGRYDAGELEEQEYDRQERVLLEHLSHVREIKAQRERGEGS